MVDGAEAHYSFCTIHHPPSTIHFLLSCGGSPALGACEVGGADQDDQQVNRDDQEWQEIMRAVDLAAVGVGRAVADAEEGLADFIGGYRVGDRFGFALSPFGGRCL